MSEVLRNAYLNLCQRLRQFGRLDAGRLLGTVPSTHGGYLAWMDLFEKAVFLRAEGNAVVKLLMDKGIVTQGEWLERVTDEMAHMMTVYGEKWPEIEVDASGSGFTVKDLQAFAKRCQKEGWPS